MHINMVLNSIGTPLVLINFAAVGLCVAQRCCVQVCVSDGATVVCTTKGDVLALYGYTTKKIGLRQPNIQKIQVKNHMFNFY